MQQIAISSTRLPYIKMEPQNNLIIALIPASNPFPFFLISLSITLMLQLFAPTSSLM